MNKEYIWQSNLGPYIKDFIALKKSNGFSYETEKYYLIQFDKLCMSNDEFNKEGISKELSDKWSIQSQTEGKTYRSKRVCATRQLGLYLLSIGKEAYIPHFKGSLDKTITYIPTFKELQSLFKYIDKYIPGNNNRISLQLAIIYPIIFRLMFCCGLRLSETTKIKCDLIDLNKGTLTILKSKGLKERMIPIAQDVCELCKIYNKKISKLVPQRIYFFPGKDKDVAIANPTVQKKFHKFWLQAFPYWNNKFPTCHSLRYHNLS